MRTRTSRSIRTIMFTALLALIGAMLPALTVPAQAQTVDCTTVPWMDTSKTANQRARALLDASTLEQKMRWLNEQAAKQPEPDDVFSRWRPDRHLSRATALHAGHPVHRWAGRSLRRGYRHNRLPWADDAERNMER
jgi:hypothetical protein